MSTAPIGIEQVIARVCDVSDGCVSYVGPLRNNAGHLYRVSGILSGTSLMFAQLRDALANHGRCECHFDGRLHVYLYTDNPPTWGSCIAYLVVFLSAIWFVLPDVHKERFAGFASLWLGSQR